MTYNLCSTKSVYPNTNKLGFTVIRRVISSLSTSFTVRLSSPNLVALYWAPLEMSVETLMLFNFNVSLTDLTACLHAQLTYSSFLEGPRPMC